MALDFPTSPTDGQIYDNYYWDNTNSVWRLLGDSLEVAADFSNTATGTYTDGFDYKYVSFTASGSLTVTRGGYADILVVGGGGGGGRADAGGYGGAGGGGAGQVLEITNYYLGVGNHTVVVGNGGSASSSITDHTGNGEHSSLGNITALGGGQGGNVSGNANFTNGFNGACGGGTASSSGGGSTRPGIGLIGFDGGTTAGTNDTGGGGGGMGAAGEQGQESSTSGAGGDGITSSITGTSVYYAGGGAGGNGISSTAGVPSGGLGGGGDGGNNNPSTPGQPGTANTGGGGGGGADQDGTANPGGNGGSGIVIVRVRTN